MNLFTNQTQALKGSPKIRKGSIAFAVLDDREIIKHDLVRYLVETYTENTLYNFYKRKCDILGFYKENQIDEIIDEAYNKNYDLLVVMKNGTFMNTSFFFENVKKMINQNIGLMGHVLDYGEKHYFLHEQCFFINLKAWKLSGSPKYFSNNKNVMVIDRAPVNFHDNYTPKWVKKSNEFKEYNEVLPGGYMMSEFLKSDFGVSPFTELRELKWFTYHGDTMKALMKFIRMGDIKNEDTFFSTETELIDEIDLSKENIDTLISIASAFHPFKVIKKSNLNLKNIIIYDISKIAIDVYKNMLNVWDGNDYLTLLKTTKGFKYRNTHNEHLANKSFEEMINLCGSKEQWKNFYFLNSKLNKEFFKGNLLSESHQKKFLNNMTKDKVCLFHVSNIFSYEAHTNYIDIFQRFFSFFNLFMEMKQHTKKTIFKGSIFNLNNYTSTDDMDLNDFIVKANELCFTPWQKERFDDFKNSLTKRYNDIWQKN